MNRKKNIAIATVVILLIIAYSFYNKEKNKHVALTVKVKRGDFIHEVITSGELRALSSKKILGPSRLKKFRIQDVKIQDLIPEGSVVKKGDYVGRLDPSDVNEKILNARQKLEQSELKYAQKKLDTMLTLKQERNAINDMAYNIKESGLELKESVYEPPTTIKRLKNKIEKYKRDLREKKENYMVKKKKAEAQMFEVGTEVSKTKKRLDDLMALLQSFTIYSDYDGMITYAREWNGRRKKVGSSITAWDLSIAEVPDLTEMESVTYVNEVDIRKIKNGLAVKVGFDAFPEIQLDGTITSVANVGEKKMGSDIKAFRVMIRLDEQNNEIKPGMTTSNRIETFREKDVLTIPLEAVFSNDTINYVYVKSSFSIKKKQVALGVIGNDVAIVKKGLKENDVVYLNRPKGLDGRSIILLD